MSFKVIDGDGGGPSKEERERKERREWVSSEFSSVLRELAANMLRVVRGAGKGSKLLTQMNAVIECAIRYRNLHDCWPSNDLIAGALRLEDEMEEILECGRAGMVGQNAIDRWEKEMMMAEHTMYRGVLQIVASGLIGQSTQKCAGESEFHEGLRRLEKIREAQRQKFLEQQRASRSTPRRPTPKKRKLKPRKPPDDVVL
jgi:hypothetical protein